jgi:hypothetical protein
MQSTRTLTVLVLKFIVIVLTLFAAAVTKTAANQTVGAQEAQMGASNNLSILEILNPLSIIFAQKDESLERTPLQAENFELVNQFGGPSSDVTVQGQYAYLDEAPGISILNIADPTAPYLVDKWLPASYKNGINYVEAAGNYLYATSLDGLYILDIATPTA